MLQRLLTGFGLNAKETAVFEKLLEVGIQPASSIARLTEIPRNTVRGILDGLVERGLLIRTIRANTQYYAPETKEGILKMLDTRAEQIHQDLNEQRRLVLEYGDELTTWSSALSRPRISFYEGISGLKRVYEDTLQSREGLRSWASFDVNDQALPEYFRTYYLRRARRGIHMTSIHPDTTLARIHQKNNRKELRLSALVPASLFNPIPEIQVYDDKVNIASWREKLGIIIQSQEIADAFKAIFALSFEGAEKFKMVKGVPVKRRPTRRKS